MRGNLPQFIFNFITNLKRINELLNRILRYSLIGSGQSL